MASCPIHIWVPLMAAGVPAARYAKDRVSLLRGRMTRQAELPADELAPLKRWAPIGAPVPVEVDADR